MTKKLLGLIVITAMIVFAVPAFASAEKGNAGASVWDGSVDVS